MLHGVHLIFDLLACAAAFAAGQWQKRSAGFPDNPHINSRYILVMLIGAVLGGYGLGTLNLAIGHQFVLSHSILGALIGAILFIEVHKMISGIKTPTGAAYAVPFCMAATVGRLGCGLEDMTYGIPTTLSWGVDFGDGIARHPVQLYETFVMLLVMMGCFVWQKKNLGSYLD